MKQFRTTFSRDPEEVLGLSVSDGMYVLPYYGDATEIESDGVSFELHPGYTHGGVPAPRALLDAFFAAAPKHETPANVSTDPNELEDLVAGAKAYLPKCPPQSALPSERTDGWYLLTSADVCVRMFGLPAWVAAQMLKDLYPAFHMKQIVSVLETSANRGFCDGAAEKRKEIATYKAEVARAEDASRKAMDRVLKQRAERKPLRLADQELVAIVFEPSVFTPKTPWLGMYLGAPTLTIDSNRYFVFKNPGFALDDKLEIETGVTFRKDLVLNCNGDDRSRLAARFAPLPPPIVSMCRPRSDIVNRTTEKFLDLRSPEARAVRDDARGRIGRLLGERDSELLGLATAACFDLCEAYGNSLSPITLVSLMHEAGIDRGESERAIVRALEGKAPHFFRRGEFVVSTEPKEAA